ncbi:type II toxin-antitoxin system VapC family toxin [Candidatus Peregrinibacteria bacterium]|nr:type II toxin-antitoxin system VapC family toxin [Candidatus Peregrinibacteria bacterium]
MNIVDSSAWLEFFAGTKHGERFSRIIENTKSLMVPTVILYEVFKKILIEKNEETALKIVAHMKLGKIIDLDLDIALSAGAVSMHTKLPFADSVILATSQKYDATLWTLDSDFKGLPRVKYFAKSG